MVNGVLLITLALPYLSSILAFLGLHGIKGLPCLLIM